MKFRVIASTVSLLLAGCATSVTRPDPNWRNIVTPGFHIAQDDPHILNEFMFRSDTIVQTWIGDKQGLTASPMMNWRLDEKGRLVIWQDDGITYPPLELLEVRESFVLGRIPDGTHYKFLIKKNEK